MALDQVRLYYLGGLSGPVPKEGHPARPIYVRSRGRLFALPPVGDYLDVSEAQARDLIARNKTTTPQGDFDVFTRDSKLAARVKAGDLARPTETKDGFTVDELQAMLAQAKAAEKKQKAAVKVDDTKTGDIKTDDTKTADELSGL
jgi:hypothetical protein